MDRIFKLNLQLKAIIILVNIMAKDTQHKSSNNNALVWVRNKAQTKTQKITMKIKINSFY